MPSLQVRELPEQIYQKLKQEAEKRHRTLAQQAIITLAKGLKAPLDAKSQRKDVLERMKLEADVIAKYRLSNPVQLIREDRNR